jgi:hypothetical protein
MKLTNEHIIENTEATAFAAGVSVDGLFFKRGASFGAGLAVNYFGIGFNPANNNSIDFDAPSGVTFNFNRNIVIGSSTLKTNEIDYTGGVGTTWKITTVNGDLKLETQNATATISLNNAVVVKENRLAQGLPFPVTQVASADSNTLDDYEEGTWTPTLYGGALQNLANSNPSFKRLMTTTSGDLASYANPARAYYTTGGLVEEVGLYGPIGSGSSYTYRDIPITVEYAQYVKIGKKVTCWVNFTISPTFNWITTTYTGTFAATTPTSVYTAGSNASRCDFLYATNGTWLDSCAIGLTLPFGTHLEPTAGSVGAILPTGMEDRLSDTVLAGSFNLQIDNNVNPSFGSSPTYPVIQYPALYQNPLTYTAGVATGGDVSTSGAVGLTANALPINPTGKSEIRLGKVQTRLLSGSSSYSPAALFFGERDVKGVDAFSNSGFASRNAGTSKLSPVTAFDCIYEAWVPTSAPADSNYQDKLIRFQCHFTYETAN